MPDVEVVAVLEHAGEEREYRYAVAGAYADSQEFLWTEGNYSCDCNRSLFFWNWKRDERECGSGKRYRLVSLAVGGVAKRVTA